jgi:hypothetical protein
VSSLEDEENGFRAISHLESVSAPFSMSED